jgi:hypothetical protein
MPPNDSSSVPSLHQPTGTSSSSGNPESGNSSSGHSSFHSKPNASPVHHRKRRLSRTSNLANYYHVSPNDPEKDHVYCLYVRQHPERARAIGFSDKDR